MAEKLRISDRAYSDLARGKYCFSTAALLFLLLAMEEEERKSFFNELGALVHGLENKEAG